MGFEPTWRKKLTRETTFFSWETNISILFTIFAKWFGCCMAYNTISLIQNGFWGWISQLLFERLPNGYYSTLWLSDDYHSLLINVKLMFQYFALAISDVARFGFPNHILGNQDFQLRTFQLDEFSHVSVWFSTTSTDYWDRTK